MTKEEAIKYLQQLYPQGGHCWLDEQRIEAIGMAIKALQEEPVSDDYRERYKNITRSDAFKSAYENKSLGEVMSVEGEEPVSEDLEEAATLYAKEEYSRKNPATLSDRCIGCYAPIMYAFRNGANWREEQIMANTADAVIGLPYENKDGGYTHLIDVSRPLPVGNNKIAIIFKED